MAIIGTSRPTGSAAPAVSAVITNQIAPLAASAGAPSACAAPRRKSARTTSSPLCSISVAAGWYWEAWHGG